MKDQKITDILKLSHIILIIYSCLAVGAAGYLVFLDVLCLDTFYPKAVSNRNGILITTLIVTILVLVVLTWLYRFPTFKKHRCLPFVILYVLGVGAVAIVAVTAAFALKRGEKETAYQMIQTYLRNPNSDQKAVEWFISKYQTKIERRHYVAQRTTSFVVPFLVVTILWFILQISITTYLVILKPPFSLPKDPRKQDRKRSQRIEDANEPL